MNTKNNPENAIVIIDSANREVLIMRRDGSIFWRHPTKGAMECSDFRDLAKAFMYVLYSFNPRIDWKGVAPEIYDEIKHLIKS